jgi:hypothetical protein
MRTTFDAEAAIPWYQDRDATISPRHATPRHSPQHLSTQLNFTQGCCGGPSMLRQTASHSKALEATFPR